MEEGQHRRPVDGQQDEQHDQERDTQQQPVDRPEGFDEVRQDAALSAHQRGQTLGRLRDDVADVIDRRDDLVAVGGLERHHDLSGGTVLRREGRTHLARVDVLDPLQVLDVPGQGITVSVGEAPFPREDDGCGQVLCPRELHEVVKGDRGLGALGKERRVVVLLHRGQLTREGRLRAAHNEPQQHHERRQDPTPGTGRRSHVHSVPFWSREAGSGTALAWSHARRGLRGGRSR